MRRKPFSITIDRDLYDYLKAKAAAENRTLSNLIETIINEWIDKHK